MDKVIGVVTSGKASLSKGRHDDDFADRLSARYTPLILIVFTIVVTIQQLVRNPITCWTPVHFTDSHMKYANNYCWVRSTYYLPFEENIPHPTEERQVLKYYQWIQFILLAQAACFFLPTLVWRTFNSKAGVDADSILQMAHHIPEVKNADKREEMSTYLAAKIDTFLQSRKPDEGCSCDVKHLLSGVLCRCCGRRIGNFLILLYIFQKLLFIANIVLQFFALNALLGNKYYLYGPNILKEPIPDHKWDSQQFVAFPRVTMCDFQVRRLGNIHRYTLQCVLPLNLYIEKMYVFLWFWMFFVFVMLVCTFFMWVIRFACRKDRLNFIKNHLNGTKQLLDEDDMQLLHPFIDEYLRQDGAFLLRLVATNTNTVSTGQIVKGVWRYWLEKTGHMPHDEDEGVLPPEKQPLTEDDDGDKPKVVPNNIPGLKKRNLSPIEEKDELNEKPRKPVARNPTMYIRGGDTLGRDRPPSDLYPEVTEKPPKGDSEDSGHEDTPPASKPSAPSSEDTYPPSDESDPDVNKTNNSDTPADDDKGDGSNTSLNDGDGAEPIPSLYPNLDTKPIAAPRRAPSAPPEGDASATEKPPLATVTDL